jgi:hypothetical protein
LVGAYPRVRPVDAVMASAVVTHTAVSRATNPNAGTFAPSGLRPGAVLEPLVLLLSAAGGSLMFATAIAGIFG